MAGTTSDALTAARFSITIDGSEIATFSELTGITTSVDVVDFIESSDKEVVMRKLPGKRNPPTVVLKRGKNNSMELWAWHDAVLQGNMAAARRSCSLVMYNVDGKPVRHRGTWPARSRSVA